AHVCGLACRCRLDGTPAGFLVFAFCCASYAATCAFNISKSPLLRADLYCASLALNLATGSLLLKTSLYANVNGSTEALLELLLDPPLDFALAAACFCRLSCCCASERFASSIFFLCANSLSAMYLSYCAPYFFHA